MFFGNRTIWYLHSQTVYVIDFEFYDPFSAFRVIPIAFLFENKGITAKDYKLVENQL